MRCLYDVRRIWERIGNSAARGGCRPLVHTSHPTSHEVSIHAVHQLLGDGQVLEAIWKSGVADGFSRINAICATELHIVRISRYMLIIWVIYA